MTTSGDNRGGKLLLVGALAFLAAFAFAMLFLQPFGVVELGVAFGLLALLLLAISTRGGSDGQ